MSFWGSLGAALGISGASGAMSYFTQAALMDKQKENQKELTEWNNLNSASQQKSGLKSAGLSTATMAGAPQLAGQAAASGSASFSAPDVAGIMQAMSQQKLSKAETYKTNEEARSLKLQNDIEEERLNWFHNNKNQINSSLLNEEDPVAFGNDFGFGSFKGLMEVKQMRASERSLYNTELAEDLKTTILRKQNNDPEYTDAMARIPIFEFKRLVQSVQNAIWEGKILEEDLNNIKAMNQKLENEGFGSILKKWNAGKYGEAILQTIFELAPHFINFNLSGSSISSRSHNTNTNTN